MTDPRIDAWHRAPILCDLWVKPGVNPIFSRVIGSMRFDDDFHEAFNAFTDFCRGYGVEVESVTLSW